MRVTRRLVLSAAMSLAALTASAVPALASPSGHTALATRTAAPATSFEGLICRAPGDTACMDVKNNVVGQGIPIILYNISAGTNMTWDLVQVGTVESNGSTFTVGSGLNGRYQGAPIYQLRHRQ